MRAAQYSEPGSLAVVDVPTPAPGARDVLLDVLLCGVCGSDVSSLTHGSYVEAGQVMGHEVVGIVASVGGDVDGVRVGDMVAVLPMRSCGRCAYCTTGQAHLCGATGERSLGYGADGAFADQVLLRDVRAGAEVVVVPAGTSAEDVVWAEPVAVAVHAVGLLGDVLPASVLVVGAGSVGLCVTSVLTAVGVPHVVVVEPRPDRRAAAESLGATVADGLGATGGGPFDAVIDTSGRADAVSAALDLAAPSSCVVLVGLGSGGVPLPRRGVIVRGSFAYSVADFQRAVALIVDGSVSLGRLVSHHFPLAGAVDAILASAHDPSVVKAVVSPTLRRDTT